MPTRKKTVELAGDAWTVYAGKRDNAAKDYGHCVVDDRVIVIFNRSYREGSERETLLHECLHALFPWMEEDYITKAAEDLDNALDALGM